VELRFNVSATDGEVHVQRFVEGNLKESKRIWCFFRMDGYAPHDPPNGRRFTSVREAIRASTPQPPPLSVQNAMVGSNSGGSLMTWLHSL
jgi:hypothetical protein